MENSVGFLHPDLCITRPPGRPRMCAATLLPSRRASRQPPLASSFSAPPGCPLLPYFSGFLDLDKAMFRKISATTSAPRREICLYFDCLTGNCFLLKLNGNMSSSDGHNGIRGKKTRIPECCPTTIFASIAFF
ncbi:hypothetical protein VPH35_076290 [Triticum aestivum]